MRWIRLPGRGQKQGHRCGASDGAEFLERAGPLGLLHQPHETERQGAHARPEASSQPVWNARWPRADVAAGAKRAVCVELVRRCARRHAELVVYVGIVVAALTSVHKKKVWLDVEMKDKSAAAMEEGVRNSGCVIAIITGPTVEVRTATPVRIQRACHARAFVMMM